MKPGSSVASCKSITVAPAGIAEPPIDCTLSFVTVTMPGCIIMPVVLSNKRAAFNT